MPESPAYYITKGQKDEAIESLKYLRGKSAAGVQDELQNLQTNIDDAMKKKATVGDLFSNKGNFKALIISSGLLAFQQLSGINAVLFYSTDIFIAASGGSGGMDPAVSTILVGVCMVRLSWELEKYQRTCLNTYFVQQVLASGVTPLIADKLGRKIILAFSAGGMVVFLVALGFYFMASAGEWAIAPSITWLPVVSMIAFVLVYCVGFGPLPWAVMGEMFAPEVKSVASSIVASVCWICGFLVTQFFGSISTALGAHWSFWIFAVFCSCAFAFVVFIVIETKGLSLQQIQDKLNGR